MQDIFATWLGRVPYAAALETQRLVAELRAEDKLADTLLLLEHEPVYTLGRRGSMSDVLDPRGIEVVVTDRGGLVTYHGPGQLVGYPIMHLGPRPDLPGYVHRLERVMHAVARNFGVEAGAVAGHPGVWVGEDKVGAIGVHVSRGITTHGLALNVNPDLSAFNGIVPCGLVDKGVTSLERVTGVAPAMSDVVDATVSAFADVFQRPVRLIEMDFADA